VAELELLNQLKDIHLPEPIGIWPLAKAWWFLVVFLLILGIVIWGLYRYRTQYLIKREFLSRLREYKIEYKASQNTSLALNKLALLLKQVALFYYPRKQVASLYGLAWIEFLELNGPKNYSSFLLQWFTESLYQAKSHINVEEGFKFVELWIKEQGKRCMN
jgi:hypothetical protein